MSNNLPLFATYGKEKYLPVKFSTSTGTSSCLSQNNYSETLLHSCSCPIYNKVCNDEKNPTLPLSITFDFLTHAFLSMREQERTCRNHYLSCNS